MDVGFHGSLAGAEIWRALYRGDRAEASGGSGTSLWPGLCKPPRPDCQRPSRRALSPKIGGFQGRRRKVASRMNVVERAPAQGTSLPAEPPQPVAEAPPPAPGAARGRSSSRCSRSSPMSRRYRGRALAALAALLVAALATLAVPLAVRRMIDFGFTHQGMNLIDSYFAVMIAVAGVLAVASAARYYLVITLGERIVADLRSDVFNHLTVALGLLFRPGQDRRDFSRGSPPTPPRSNPRSARRCRSHCATSCCSSARPS